jgi:hypothetical protein
MRQADRIPSLRGIRSACLMFMSNYIKASIEEYQWPKESTLDFVGILKLCNTWDKFWGDISKTSHSEIFRMEWDQKFRSFYEKKN